MASIENREKLIIEDFNSFEEWEDKYLYIIEAGEEIKQFDERDKIEKNLVKGCLSKVWLILNHNDEKIFFKTFSDAPIPKGLSALICNIYSGSTKNEILNFESDFFDKTEILNYLSPSRQNGILSIVKKILNLTKSIK